MSIVDEHVELSDGARLWVATDLRPGLEAMVLVHGGPGLWDYLAPVAELVAGRVSTIRYDQRGCGRSSPSGEYSMRRYVEDLEELRERRGFERWWVLGHSFGGALALAYAAAYPERVLGVVHLNGVGLHWSRHRERFHAEWRARLSAQQLARFGELDARERTWAEEVEWRELVWAPDDPDPALAPTRLPINAACNRAISSEQTAAEGDAVVAAAGLSVPVLLVHGERDPRPIDGVLELRDALPSARLVVLEGAGHEPWVRHADALREAVLDFLDTP